MVTYPLSPFVSEIFDLKVADKQTHRQTFTSTDNKGRLKVSAREPTITYGDKDIYTEKTHQ